MTDDINELVVKVRPSGAIETKEMLKEFAEKFESLMD